MQAHSPATASPTQAAAHTKARGIPAAGEQQPGGGYTQSSRELRDESCKGSG